MKPDRNITDPQLAKALAHPLRIRVLTILGDRVASPSEIAHEIDANLSLVSYHVRRLAHAGLIELVREKQRRGAVEHYYKAVERPVVTTEAWSKTPSIVKQAVIRGALTQVSESVNSAAAAGGFERDDIHLTRSPMRLDEESFHQVAGRLDALLKDLEQIAREAEERLQDDEDAPAIDATAVLMLFESLKPLGVPQRFESDDHAPARREPRSRLAD